jgi:hypothetical protein
LLAVRPFSELDSIRILSNSRVAFLSIGWACQGKAKKEIIYLTEQEVDAYKSEEVADYLIDAGKELVERCEDLYERSGELVEDATHELAGKYRALCPSAPRQDLAHGHPDPEEQRLAEFLSAFGHFFRFRENRVFHAFRAVRTPAYPTPRPNSS